MATQSTRDRIVALRHNYPDLPAVRIAEFLQISRERVRQILKGEGLPTRIRHDYGKCIVCDEPMQAGRKSYCSVECRSADCRVTFRCDYCGESKELLQSIYNAQKRRGYKFMYCSISCRNYGKWESVKKAGITEGYMQRVQQQTQQQAVGVS